MINSCGLVNLGYVVASDNITRGAASRVLYTLRPILRTCAAARFPSQGKFVAMGVVSISASVLAIATVGVQVSIKLIAFASQISTASDRSTSIGNDVSLTSGVLQQLGELMTQKATEDDRYLQPGITGDYKVLSRGLCEDLSRD